MASTLRYLTVQDVLWINLQATKRVNGFSFARLEEATFYQYAYGESNTLLPQAARFVTGFSRMNALEAGNEVTAFLALIAFLRVNGMQVGLRDEDAYAWFSEVVGNPKGAREAISRIAEQSHDEHHGPDDMPNVPTILGSVVADYPRTIARLAEPAASGV